MFRWLRVLNAERRAARSETVKLLGELSVGLCNECRTFAACRDSGVCSKKDTPIDEALLQRMRDAETELDARQE